MNIITHTHDGKEDGSEAEVRCDRERNARYLNWKCVRAETRNVISLLLTLHIAEEGIGTDVPLIFASGMKVLRFASHKVCIRIYNSHISIWINIDYLKKAFTGKEKLTDSGSR